jgi:hypothetical protein
VFDQNQSEGDSYELQQLRRFPATGNHPSQFGPAVRSSTTRPIVTIMADSESCI